MDFDLLAESASGLVFSLTGPNGFSGFTNIAASSGLVTLPTAGTYTLIAQGIGGATGSFSFEVEQTSQTTLTLGTAYAGTFAGSGPPQLSSVTLPTASPLLLSLVNTSGDQVQLYARRNGAPTRQVYDDAADGAGSSQSILVPRTAAGTWYILAYAVSVANPPGHFTMLAAANPVVVTAVTPVKYATASVASLTLTGSQLPPARPSHSSPRTAPRPTRPERDLRHLHPAHREHQPGRRTTGDVLDPGDEREGQQRHSAGRVHRDGRRAGRVRDPPDPPGRRWVAHLVERSTSSIPTGARPPCPRRSSCWSPPWRTTGRCSRSTRPSSSRSTGPWPSPPAIRTRSRSWPAARCRACSNRASRSRCRSTTAACRSPGPASAPRRSSTSTRGSSSRPTPTWSTGPPCSPRRSRTASRTPPGRRSTTPWSRSSWAWARLR